MKEDKPFELNDEKLTTRAKSAVNNPTFKEIPIKRELSEETRLQSIWVKPNAGVFSLHFKDGFYYITSHSDYTKIYAVFAEEMHKLMFSDD